LPQGQTRYISGPYKQSCDFITGGGPAIAFLNKQESKKEKAFAYKNQQNSPFPGQKRIHACQIYFPLLLNTCLGQQAILARRTVHNGSLLADRSA
jgi:hypothetical protein